MTKRLVVPLIVVTVWLAGAAAAQTSQELGREEVTLSAPVPCAAVCPYWTDDLGHEGSCQPEPFAPDGSWADHRFTVPEQLAGRTPALLHIHATMTSEYDNFLCRVIDPGAPTERWTEVACFCNVDSLGAPCDEPLRVEFACDEEALVRIAPGGVYVLRAYNWLAYGSEHVVLRWLA